MAHGVPSHPNRVALEGILMEQNCATEAKKPHTARFERESERTTFLKEVQRVPRLFEMVLKDGPVTTDRRERRTEVLVLADTLSN